MYDKFDKTLDILVRKAIDSRYLTLALFLFAFIASLLLPMLGTEFIPQVDPDSWKYPWNYLLLRLSTQKK